MYFARETQEDDSDSLHRQAIKRRLTSGGKTKQVPVKKEKTPDEMLEERRRKERGYFGGLR